MSPNGGRPRKKVFVDCSSCERLDSNKLDTLNWERSIPLLLNDALAKHTSENCHL